MNTWQPPDDPDVHAIMDEAARDTRDCNYETALAKFLWFHENSRGVPGLGGVRLSFALGYWFDLAQKYPPALEAFVTTRDEAAKKVFEATNSFKSFHELTALNRKLKEFDHTVNVFKKVVESRPDQAKHLYHAAEPALIKSGEFALCGMFLDPIHRLKQASECYSFSQDFEKRRPRGIFPIPDTSRKHFVENITTLVMLLVLNNRKDEAHRVRYFALETLDDEDFRLSLDTAMSGHFPSIDWPGEEFVREMNSTIKELKQKKHQEG
ncbi:MAG: hypothetical protein O2955_10060 [Planctomycetota bacterium]|nr:hypothetical protein [Planctomycetota bacterium]MDA1212855.1 hypothetical protein [Planctomycetota bacterium]